MIIQPSHWLDGCCFKCVRHKECNTIGDAVHKCEEYELDRSRWYDETTQMWEHRIQQRTVIKNPQTTLARWF